MRDVREAVAPLDLGTDLLNVNHRVIGKPQCDPDRAGLWGGSFSGMLSIYAVERDLLPKLPANLTVPKGLIGLEKH